jgi:hypothetical protein
MFPGMSKHLRLLAPDPYDYILSKLERNTSKDRDDADYLFRTQKLDSRALWERAGTTKRSNFGSRSLRPLRNSQTPATQLMLAG